ncbi:Do family serine endopeptidase [Sphingomonas psychrotolerans]|uniref:Probable periplasmic serine endoprotease DegP-like n=1 Tax=Sphingomonas psychrotolerans TaxID=1327635 RepID=A0ABU3N3V3_9SPHN|nr:Do family serine endopeptidase [Sphingomonas psychrotolerans]MDT8758951.1 Do family serine endopeptidase [Sphingomonas psychrotolerans]
MRYVYALTTALALGSAATALTLNHPAGAQTAQNEPGSIQAAAPRGGAPMSFADMVAKLQPAVVNISTTQRITVQQQNPFQGTPFENFFGAPRGGGSRTQEAQSLGSGFLISADGYIVTNNHVVSAGTQGATVESITVTLPDRREFTAKLVGRDPSSDLAVLKIQGNNFPFVRFGDSRQARVGDWVVAIGNPFGLSGTVSAGIVSAVNRVTGGGAYDRFIQTDASINRGNSGGPMFDLQGNVIGINSQILSPTGGNVGIGFAIPAEQAKPIVETLMRGENVTRGYLGIGIQPVTDDIAGAIGASKDRGEIIGSVEPGQPGDRAGLRPGDVVLAINGQDVTPEQTLSYIIARQKPGSRVSLDILRDGRRQQLTATVGTRPSDEELAARTGQGFDPDATDDGAGAPASASSTLGLAVQPLNPQIARSLRLDPGVRGVVVTAVDPDSDAATKGFGRGVVITRVNNTPVVSAADLARAVQEARSAGRKQVLLYVMIQGQPRLVGVDIEASR